VAAWIDSLPRILAVNSLLAVIGALERARTNHRANVWGLGGHVIKCGLAPVLTDLMRRGYVTAFALNGAAAIHDFEIALAGHTSEDMEAELPGGRFGTAEETGREMNRAVVEGDSDGLGMGEALGRRVERLAAPEHTSCSLLLQAYRHPYAGKRRMWRWAPIFCTHTRRQTAPRSEAPACAISGCSVPIWPACMKAACI